MIRSLIVKGLFGRFNYNVELKSEGTTIITGPNGFGKSTLLKIIYSISSLSIQYFFDIQYDVIKLVFDNYSVEIKRENDHIYINDLDITPLKRLTNEYYMYKRRRSYIRYTPNGYIDIRTGKHVGNIEVLPNMLHDDQFWEEYCSYGHNKKTETLYNEFKEIMLKIECSCGKVKLISEQRLIEESVIDDDIVTSDVVNELPKSLKRKISTILDEYSKVSNDLDSSYPSRLFATKVGLENKSEYESLLDKTNRKFTNLAKYNLVTMGKIAKTGYTKEYSKALKIYFEDFGKKYQVFEDLVGKLDLFTRIINSRLQFKEMQVDKEYGFRIFDEKSKVPIELSKLSSGEKQEIVLFYDLIFDAEKDVLLLIDEPEISLHISWQKMFMDDLLDVSKETGIQSIIATHSPQIVSRHLNIQIDLGELYKYGLN